MKQSVEIQLENEYGNRLSKLPDFIATFAQSVENKYSLNTLITYLKDYTTFFEYLMELNEFSHYQDINEFKLHDFSLLSESDIIGFLSYLSHYKKTFIKQNGEKTTQWFKNDRIGKSRKLASIRTLFRKLSRDKSNDIIDITQYVEVVVKRKVKIKERINPDELEQLKTTISEGLNINDSRSEKLHQKHRTRDFAILMLLAFTGIRISELVQIDIKDIHLTSAELKVIRKGGNEAIIPIPDEIIPDLMEYNIYRISIEIKSQIHKDAYFLSSHNKRIHPRTVRSMLSKYKERSGIDIHVTPHTLRRTFGTELLDATGNIQLVSDLLGHVDVNTTRNSYAETTKHAMKKATENFTYCTQNFEKTRETPNE